MWPCQCNPLPPFSRDVVLGLHPPRPALDPLQNAGESDMDAEGQVRQGWGGVRPEERSGLVGCSPKLSPETPSIVPRGL